MWLDLSGLLFQAILAFFTFRMGWRRSFFRSSSTATDDKVLDSYRSSATCVKVIVAFLLFLSVQVIAVLLSARVVGRPIGTYTLVFGMLLAFATVSAFTRLVNKPLWDDLWHRPDKISLMKKGAMVWLYSYFVVNFINNILSAILFYGFSIEQADQAAVNELKIAMASKLAFYLMSLCVVTIVPVVEEILFRGFLQSWLRSRFSPFVAIAITSLVFAFFHYGSNQGMANIPILTSLFLFSCYLGQAYERYRSIIPSVVLHICFNFVGIILVHLSA